MEAILDWIKKLFYVHQQKVLYYCCTRVRFRVHWFPLEENRETAYHTLQCLNPENTISTAYANYLGNNIGLNQDVVLRASTTDVALLFKGFMDFCLKTAEKQLITHCNVSTPNILFWTVYANKLMMAILDWIKKLFFVHQQQVLCYCCTRFCYFCLKTAEKQLVTHCCVSTSNILFWTVYAN